MIASGSIDSIQWIASFGDLLLGTSGSEYKATGTDGVITPSGVSIVAQSYWGSSGGLAPLIIGNSVMHVQRHGSRYATCSIRWKRTATRQRPLHHGPDPF